MAIQEPGPLIGEDDEDVAPQDDIASVVAVDKNEDVAAVCGRVDGAPTWAVVIHAPDGNRQLSTELGMRRLIHHAADAGKVIAIATRSSSLGSRARELGLPVSRKPQHIRWDAGGRRVMRMGRLNIAPPSIGRYIQLGFIAAVALAGVYLLFAMAPSATVTAYPATETVSQLVSLTASEGRTEVDLDAMEVPATRVSSEQKFTLALKTTGTTQVGVLPAKAVVRVTNNTPAAVAIVSGTVLNAGAQRQAFAFDDAVTVPAGGSVEAAVTALEPGIAGNLAAGTITAFAEHKFGFLAVSNTAPAAGGTSEPRPAVDGKDVTALKDLARALENSDTVKQGLTAARPEDAIFMGTADGQVEFGETRPAVGIPADVVLLDVTVTVSALAVVQETLDLVAARVLNDHASGGEFIEGSVRATETGTRELDTESGDIRTELLVEGQLARGPSAAAIRNAVKGKSEGAARSTLSSRYGIQDADVRLSSWAPRLPRFGFRIDVKLAARETPSSTGTNSLNDARTRITTASTPSPGTGPR